MRRQYGFTVIELLTVVGVAAILAFVAVPSFTKTIATQRLKSAASNMQAALLMARSEGIKRNGNVTVTPVAGGTDFSQGWKITDTSTSTVVGNFPPYASLTITGPSGGVTYQSSGRITATATTTFKVSSSSITDIRCVNITVMGVPSVTTSGC